MLRVVVLHRLGRDRLGTIDLESPMQFKVYKQWLCIIHGWASELCPLLGPWCPSLPLLTKSNSTQNAQYPLGYIHTLQICCSHFCARLIHLNVVCADLTPLRIFHCTNLPCVNIALLFTLAAIHSHEIHQS